VDATISAICSGVVPQQPPRRAAPFWAHWVITSAKPAEIWSDGKKLKTVSLAVEQTFTVTGKNGTNVVTVRGGTVAVTEADCPDSHCIKRGFCSGGADIVCLPNRLVIRFVGKQAVDGVVG